MQNKIISDEEIDEVNGIKKKNNLLQEMQEVLEKKHKDHVRKGGRYGGRI